MKKRIEFVVAFLISIVCAVCAELDNAEIVRGILLSCVRPGYPTPNEEMEAFARGRGISNAEMSELLMSLVEEGLHDDADALSRRVADGALWGLSRFGGDHESEFVREIIMTTKDNGIRLTAVLAWMRIVPEKWEDMVREVAADSRFDSLTRFVTYQEAYRIGQNGDERTRRRVEQVLSEVHDNEPSPGNRLDMQKWTSELKAH